MSKTPLSVARTLRLVNHGPTVLASCGRGADANVITLAWVSPVSADPPMLAIAVAPSRYSHGLIARTRQFVINVPSSRMLDAVWYCGTRSGRDVDKFSRAGLTAAPARVLETPLIGECFGHIECRVAKAWTVGDHTLFVGEAVAASVESDAFDGHLRLEGRYHTLHHLGGPQFVTSAGTRMRAA
jgi:flavin reductase (DIM6/NTAB) family NADH-FMN oxidoreductase RutF